MEVEAADDQPEIRYRVEECEKAILCLSNRLVPASRTRVTAKRMELTTEWDLSTCGRA